MVKAFCHVNVPAVALETSICARCQGGQHGRSSPWECRQSWTENTATADLVLRKEPNKTILPSNHGRKHTHTHTQLFTTAFGLVKHLFMVFFGVFEICITNSKVLQPLWSLPSWILPGQYHNWSALRSGCDTIVQVPITRLGLRLYDAGAWGQIWLSQVGMLGSTGRTMRMPSKIGKLRPSLC